MEKLHDLKFLGWNPFFESQLEPREIREFTIARVSIEFKNQYRLISSSGEFQGEPSGSLLYSAEGNSALPKVGDWVLMTPYDENKSIIQRVLARKTQLSRKAAGRSVEEQVIAANLDILFIVQGLDDNFNINRLERYLSIIKEGIKPAVILNKSDQCSDSESKAQSVRERMPHVTVLTMSALYGNVSILNELLSIGMTAGFVGSSGTGKSTIINRLCGMEILQTGHVRDSDNKGRHTTTRRQLIVLSNGSIVVDTPGMRELQLWETGDSFGYAFPELEQLATQCRFRDCSHTVEDGCAVLHGLDTQQLSYEQYRNYLKLRREDEYLLTLRNDHAYLKRKELYKKMQRRYNQMKRGK